MTYSEKYKWMFIHVPKNAGSSVQLSVSHGFNDTKYVQEKIKTMAIQGASNTLLSPGPLHHNKYSFWKNHPDISGKDLEPIALLRNPWARCLSLYLYNIHHATKSINEPWAVELHARLVNEGFKKSWMPGGFFRDEHGMDVEYNKETGRAWSQGEDQYSWLEDDNGECAGTWYRLEDQLDEFCDRTRYPIPPRTNTTPHGNYRNYYDDELAGEIKKVFIRDVMLGDYKF